MRILLICLLVFFENSWAQYEPGTLEALQYLNHEWVDKPRQRAHERELARIKAQSEGASNNWRAAPSCVSQPVYGHGGILLGFREFCY